jgi:hypothetical protein
MHGMQPTMWSTSMRDAGKSRHMALQTEAPSTLFGLRQQAKALEFDSKEPSSQPPKLTLPIMIS